MSWRQTEFVSIVSAKGIEAKQTRFDDMHHGWTAARSVRLAHCTMDL